MHNARRMDDRITIGSVPDREDLQQLSDLGFRTLVDVREKEEKFVGSVERRTLELGMKYVWVPVRRENIILEDVIRFYRVVFDAQSAPLYVFSRFGKKPLAFLLLFDAVARDEPLGRLFQRASRMGLDIQGDLALQSFLVEFFNKGCVDEIVELINELRPDLVTRGETTSPAILFEGVVQREERQMIMGQQGCTIWLTGLPCAGKSTTGFALERVLLTIGLNSYVLDSDSIRHGLSMDLGHSPDERRENIRRVSHVARLCADAGLILISSFISPYRKDRRDARRLHEEAGLGFLEVFVDTPPEICAHRDRRGLYVKARAGEIRNFTGVDAPYEIPVNPDLVVRPAEASADDIAWKIIVTMREHGMMKLDRGRMPKRVDVSRAGF